MVVPYEREADLRPCNKVGLIPADILLRPKFVMVKMLSGSNLSAMSNIKICSHTRHCI